MNTGFIKSKLLKQMADKSNSTNVNILEANVFKYGRTINISNIANATFTLIQDIVPTLSSSALGSPYFIDSIDEFKLKDTTNNIVNDGYYLLKTNINKLLNNCIGWTNDNIYIYYIKNGLPIKYAESGIYYSPQSNIVKNVVNNIINDPEDGYYYLPNPYNIFYSINGQVSYLSNGTYLLNFNKSYDTNIYIFDINNNIIQPYDKYFININTDMYYINHKLYGKCDIGNMIVCDENILIRCLSGWKYCNFFDID
jgi:hypothetical protein